MRLMLPYWVLHDVFEAPHVADLLAYVSRHERDFEPTSAAGKVDGAVRVSAKLRDPGPFAATLRDKLIALLPEMTARLGVAPPKRPKIEIELVGHGHGAFFKRHIDTLTAPATERDPSIRTISGVYYFHADPQRFTGGAFRLHGLGPPTDDNFVDIEPVRNSLLLFPSCAPHEVRPVECPSQRFADSRFAFNCWIHERTGVAT